jgi:hypothetical protein
MTDIRQPNSKVAASDSIGSPAAAENTENQATLGLVSESNRRERRRLIRAAVVSVPVVLTFTAGKARAAQGSPKDSAENSPAAPEAPLMAPPQDNNVGDPVEDGDLTPAEKLETFGLQRAEDQSGGSQDPFRDLDTVSDPVDLSNP